MSAEASPVLDPTVVADNISKKEKKEKKKEKKEEKKEEKKRAKEAAKEAGEVTEKPEKPVRQAVGIVVIDPVEKKVLLLSSRKRDGAFVLPRDDCKVEPEAEHPEKAALRVLLEEAGVSADYLTKTIGTFDDNNKKGKLVAQHFMYEVHAPALLDTWANADRERVWVTYEEALTITEKKRMSRLALEKCSLAAAE